MTVISSLAGRFRSCGLLFISIIALTVHVAAFADPVFEHVTTADGLSSEDIYKIYQDKRGYMWFGTAYGLDRYDGYSIRQFRHDPNHPDSISGDTVRAIYQDTIGRLWIGTYEGGLNLYNPENETFKHYRHSPTNENSLASDNIWSLAGGSHNTLLIGTFNAGLDVFDPLTGRIRHFPQAKDTTGPADNRINAIFVDPKGDIWLGTGSGLSRFHEDTNTFENFINAKAGREANKIWAIAENGNNILELATEDGLRFFDTEIQRYVSPQAFQTGISSVNDINLRSVFNDSSGNTWVGSVYTGLYALMQRSQTTLGFRPNPANPTAFSSTLIWDIYQDHSGLIWFATNDGIDVLDPMLVGIQDIKLLGLANATASTTNIISNVAEYKSEVLLASTAGIYSFPLNSKNSQNELGVFSQFDTNRFGNPTSIYVENNGSILTGTAYGHLLKLNADGQITDNWIVGKTASIHTGTITTIRPISNDTLLLGTFGNGLLLFHPSNSATVQMGAMNGPGLHQNDDVEDILITAPDTAWLATFRGLFRFNPITGQSTLIQLEKSDEQPIAQSLLQDDFGNVWVATYDGLWKLHISNNGDIVALSHIDELSAITKNPLLAIESDKTGNLWIASNKDIIRFNPQTRDVLQFGRAQGLPPNVFDSYAHLHASDGRLWFGGTDGLIGFDPASIHPRNNPPAVNIDSVSIYEDGKKVTAPVKPGGHLMLSYRDLMITFSVNAMDYGYPAANTYSYRLKGLQKEWTVASPSHQITFTNLNPGTYHLEVVAANNWGVRSVMPARIDIDVSPPWWRTWWAYTLYIAFIIAMASWYVLAQQQKIRKERAINIKLSEANRLKANFVEELKEQVQDATKELRETLDSVNLKNAELVVAHQRASEAEKVKSQFLANMSHELRTPLTAMLGYLNLLSGTKVDGDQDRYIHTIKTSSESLLSIINDTLDLSRIEAGKLLIDDVDFNLRQVIEDTLELLAPTAYQKRLELLRILPPDIPLQLRGDPLRVRQILTNLVGNAIKFTESGSVCIRARLHSRDDHSATLTLAVTDTGIGIPAKTLEQLFQAYSRGDMHKAPHIEGTGLGLSICKKLLDLMGGSIEVFSTPGLGSTFEFTLPFKLQKSSNPVERFHRPLNVLLLDPHPLSSEAFGAMLTRLGTKVRYARNPEELRGDNAELIVICLGIDRMDEARLLAKSLQQVLTPRIVLAPTLDPGVLDQLGMTFFCQALSKSAREDQLFAAMEELAGISYEATGPNASTGNPPEARDNSAGPLILVADDNKINRKLLIAMLEQNGYRTAEASNGEELLQIAGKFHWDAALVDIHMPGMNGMETASRLRTTQPDPVPPIIAVSADAMRDTREQALAAGMQDYLVKPYTESQLLALLRKHVVSSGHPYLQS